MARDGKIWVTRYISKFARRACTTASMLQAGASVNAQTTEGWAPLHLAARENRLTVVGVLLAAGGDVSQVDSNQTLPLHLAARGGDVGLFQALYRRSGEVCRQRDNKGVFDTHPSCQMESQKNSPCGVMQSCAKINHRSEQGRCDSRRSWERFWQR